MSPPTNNGTLLAARELGAVCTQGTPTKRRVAAVVAAVALRLGNTPSVCRKCYVHPAILDGYLGGDLIAALAKRERTESADPHGLRPEETAVVAFLGEAAGAR